MKKFILFSVLGVFLYSAPGYTVLGGKEPVGAAVASAKTLLNLTEFQTEMKSQEDYDQIQSVERKALEDMLNAVNSPAGRASARRLARAQKDKAKRENHKKRWDAEQNQWEMQPKPASKEDRVAPCSAAAPAAPAWAERAAEELATKKTWQEIAAASGEKMVAQPVRAKSLGDDGPNGKIFHPPVRRKTNAAPKPAAAPKEEGVSPCSAAAELAEREVMVAVVVRSAAPANAQQKSNVKRVHFYLPQEEAVEEAAREAAREAAESATKKTWQERVAAPKEDVVAQPVIAKSLGYYDPKGDVFHPPVRRKTNAAAAPKEDGVAPCSAEPTPPEEEHSHVSASATTPKKRAILVNAEVNLWMSPSYLRTLRRVTVAPQKEISSSHDTAD